jgi:hypothetical protein
MKRFKSAGQAQRFLSAHDPINNSFHLRRDHVTAAQHRAARAQAFVFWADITGEGCRVASTLHNPAQRSAGSASKLTVPRCCW